jgi:hypothetical protein
MRILTTLFTPAYAIAYFTSELYTGHTRPFYKLDDLLQVEASWHCKKPIHLIYHSVFLFVLGFAFSLGNKMKIFPFQGLMGSLMPS